MSADGKNQSMTFVARIERSEIRGQPFGLASPVLDFAALNPGYANGKSTQAYQL